MESVDGVEKRMAAACSLNFHVKWQQLFGAFASLKPYFPFGGIKSRLLTRVWVLS